MTTDKKGNTIVGPLAGRLRKVIEARKIDIVSLDPFVKSHSVEENNNSGIDDVVQVLTDMATEYNIAVDAPHHTSKGTSDPGNANRGRGASAMKDAARLVYTLSPMSAEEAKAFGITEEQRRFFIRMDSGKVNIAPARAAKWFKLVGVRLNNGTDLYPNGDEVQTIEPWTPPETWTEWILAAQHDPHCHRHRHGGRRALSDASAARERAAWKVVVDRAPGKTEAQARDIIKTWVRNGVLVNKDYDNPVTRKSAKGLHLDTTKRPG